MHRVPAFAASLFLVLTLSVSAPLGGSARAATGTYWFHGNPTDQADKQAAFANDTARSGATFNTTPPASGHAPITQTTTGAANQDYVGNPLTLYWHGPFTGTVSGRLLLDWWWTSPAATALSITVFADPFWGTSRVQPEKVIGRGVVNIPAAGAPTETHSSIFVKGTVVGELLIQVAGASIITGNTPAVFYDSTTTPSSFAFDDTALPVTPTVTFDTTTSLAFAPSTTVSAHFLGAEPQTTLERRITGSRSGRIDPNRIFVDWPLSSRSGTGQLSRSLDGGDSFRLLYDLTCAPRSRPNCLTHGGGDTENEVNLITGDVFFADQEVVVQEALASSYDHGDTFPVFNEFPVSNAGTGVDRQWLAWADPSLASFAGKPIEAFFSYHVPAVAVHVIAVTTDGTPIPQPVPQLTDVSQSGNLRVDNTNGPARGYIYVPYRNTAGYQVASAQATGYDLPTNWEVNPVTTDTPAVFPWLNLDAHGNLYAVWVTGGIVYLSISPIDDIRNKPGSGRPGRYWTPKVAVSLPAVRSAVFPAVTAGDTGRIAVTYMGSEDCVSTVTGTFPTASDSCQDAAHWNTYAAVLVDALSLTRGGPANIVSGYVNHRIDHRGQVCTSGTTCSGDRSLLDMIDLGFDQTGRVGVVFMDNNNGLAAEPRTNSKKDGPFTQFAKEVSGPSLLAPSGTRAGTISITIPENGRADPRGDASWPNTASGTNLRSLDLLGAYVSTSGPDLVARIPVADASRAGMARDLAAYNAVFQTTPPANRLQYVFRFSTAEDVFHLSMEYNSDGTIRFFGGKLDMNDRLSNGSATLAAGYHADPGYPVIGTVGNGFITLRAPLTAFGLKVGDRITGANAFSMAGPTETLEKTFFIPMRTVDASPPFDSTLGPQPQPPSNVGCDDENVQSEGGWSRMADDRAKSGGFCRNVGHDKQNADQSFQFTGTAIDLNVATGPRGGTLGFTVDGVRQAVNLYRAATGQPDNTGRHDLEFTKTVHVNVPTGTHSVRISNDSTDAYRDMVYVDGVVITGGDILTPVGHTVYEVGGTVIGTALAGTDTVMQVAIEPAMHAMDFVIETTAGTTVKIVDPSGKTLASATVDDGGVLDLQAFPDGAGAYALVLHASTAGDAAFTIWEKFAEAN